MTGGGLISDSEKNSLLYTTWLTSRLVDGWCERGYRYIPGFPGRQCRVSIKLCCLSICLMRPYRENSSPSESSMCSFFGYRSTDFMQSEQCACLGVMASLFLENRTVCCVDSTRSIGICSRKSTFPQILDSGYVLRVHVEGDANDNHSTNHNMLVLSYEQESGISSAV